MCFLTQRTPCRRKGHRGRYLGISPPLELMKLRTSEPRRGDSIVADIIVVYHVGFGTENLPPSLPCAAPLRFILQTEHGNRCAVKL
jgi:hypothetical protein